MTPMKRIMNKFENDSFLFEIGEANSDSNRLFRDDHNVMDNHGSRSNTILTIEKPNVRIKHFRWKALRIKLRLCSAYQAVHKLQLE